MAEKQLWLPIVLLHENIWISKVVNKGSMDMVCEIVQCIDEMLAWCPAYNFQCQEPSAHSAVLKLSQGNSEQCTVRKVHSVHTHAQCPVCNVLW